VAHRNLELFEIYRIVQPERAFSRLDAARRAISESMSSVRQAISTLRLVEPVENLEKALRGYLEESAPAEITARVEVNGDESWAPPETLEQAFLIIREAMRNSIAHAAASHILVRVDIAPGDLRAVVADDGRGFQPGDGGGDGTGLLSMRERAVVLGGSVTVLTTPGRGTRVELWLPLIGAPA
jgi:signal transduction histidine kinase